MWLYFFANYNISLAIHAQASASAKALFISLVYQVHHHLYHHILLLCFAFGNHQGQSNEGVISQALGTIFTIEDMIVIEEPKEEGGGNAFVGFAFLLRTSAIQSSLIALGLSSVAHR